MTCRQIGFGLALTILGPALVCAEPPALAVRLVRPDRQCARVIDLFRGTRAAHPAEALAAWKRATAPRGSLGKPLEAAIALFNPEMVPELRVLEQAELVLTFDPADGSLRWHALLPRDDGTIAALATALALTDGAREPSLGAVPVDRLGPPGAPLVARAPAGLALAGSRPALETALRAADPGEKLEDEADASGWLIRVDPDGLGHSGPIARRRLAEGLRALGCRAIEATAGIEGDTLAFDVSTRLDLNPDVAIDPAWLDGLPCFDPSTLAVFAWAIDARAEAWDRAFALADRIEKADPAYANVAPLRTRLNLLAATVKVRPEVDLWPHLRGLSGALAADPTGMPNAAVLALHTDSPESAERIARQVLPPLVSRLGRIRDRTISIAHDGPTVRLLWGTPPVAPQLQPKPGAVFRTLTGDAQDPPPQRLAALWPGRFPLTPTLGAPLADSLAESPPILWSGRNRAPGARDQIRWTGLHDLVRRLLDRLPLDLTEDQPPGPER